MGWLSKVLGDDAGKIVGGVIGFAVGGPVGALYGAGAGHMFIDQPKAAESAQEKQIAAQKAMQEKQLAAQVELAGQQMTLTERQMQLQMGQRQIELLANLFTEQDRTEPEIYYLPAAEPTSPIERFNQAIEDFLSR